MIRREDCPERHRAGGLGEQVLRVGEHCRRDRDLHQDLVELGHELEQVGPSVVGPEESRLDIQDDERDRAAERDHVELDEITDCGPSVTVDEDLSPLCLHRLLDVYAPARVETESAYAASGVETEPASARASRSMLCWLPSHASESVFLAKEAIRTENWGNTDRCYRCHLDSTRTPGPVEGAGRR